MNLHDRAARRLPRIPHVHGAFGDLLRTLKETSDAVDRELDSILPREDGTRESQLFSAMRHACLGGGKRIRPFLVIATARAFDGPESSALRVAAAWRCCIAFPLFMTTCRPWTMRTCAAADLRCTGAMARPRPFSLAMLC
jgi:hypothetical protein